MGLMCKGSRSKHLVHTLPSGLQKSRNVVLWAVTPAGMPSVPANPTLGTAGSVPSAAGAGSVMKDAGAENAWQKDMLDVSLTKSALVHAVSHSGLEPAHLVLAARLPDHTQLSQSLLHRITWHETDSAAQHEHPAARLEVQI